MYRIPTPFSVPLLLCAALAAAAGAQAAQHDAKAGADEARQRYLQERQACLSGDNPQETRASCLRDAGAALQEARRGALGASTSPGDYEENAARRCMVFRETDEQAQCLQRLKNPVSGSVSGGGILRESVTTEAPRPQPGK